MGSFWKNEPILEGFLGVFFIEKRVRPKKTKPPESRNGDVRRTFQFRNGFTAQPSKNRDVSGHFGARKPRLRAGEELSNSVARTISVQGCHME